MNTKKWSSLLLALLLTLLTASCGANGGQRSREEPQESESAQASAQPQADEKSHEEIFAALEGVWWPVVGGQAQTILVIKDGKYCEIRWPLLFAGDEVIDAAINKNETLDYASFISKHTWNDLGFNDAGDTILSDTKEVLQLNKNGALQCIQRQPAYDEWHSWSYNKKADDVMTYESLIGDFNEIAAEHGWPAYIVNNGAADPSEAKDVSTFLIEEAGLKVLYDADWMMEEPIDYQDPDDEEPIGLVNKLNLKKRTGTPVQMLIDLDEWFEPDDINDIVIPSLKDTLNKFYDGNGWVSEVKTVTVNGISCILIDEHIEMDIDCQDRCFYYLSLSGTESGPYTMAEIDFIGNGIERLHQYAEQMLFPIGNQNSGQDKAEGTDNINAGDASDSGLQPDGTRIVPAAQSDNPELDKTNVEGMINSYYVVPDKFPLVTGTFRKVFDSLFKSYTVDYELVYTGQYRTSYNITFSGDFYYNYDDRYDTIHASITYNFPLKAWQDTRVIRDPNNIRNIIEAYTIEHTIVSQDEIVDAWMKSNGW